MAKTYPHPGILRGENWRILLDCLHKWHINDAKTLKRQIEIGQMTLEQVGELFFLVMDYVAYSDSCGNYVEPEIPPALSYAFSNFQVRVDDARATRSSVGSSRAENGRKGGEAKARNARKAQAEKAATDFTPPTKRQFKSTVQQLCDDGDILNESQIKDVDSFYTSLKAAKWTIGGEPIDSNADLKSAILARFYISLNELKRSLYFPAFEYVFSEFHGLRNDSGRSLADDAVSDFFDTYDAAKEAFVVNEKEFPVKQWKKALSKFIDGWEEDIPP